MPNSKRKCSGCGERFAANLETAIKGPSGWFHSMECLAAKGREKAAKAAERRRNKAVKEEKAVHAKKKREFRRSDLKIRKEAAKKACHAYIRERDKGQPCICCGRPLGEKYDAGHFLESGNYPYIRYYEDNIHGQSVHCNQFKGGDSGQYEERLRQKIGDERVDWLKANKNQPIKRTADDYYNIERHYKKKLKDLQDGPEVPRND